MKRSSARNNGRMKKARLSRTNNHFVAPSPADLHSAVSGLSVRDPSKSLFDQPPNVLPTLEPESSRTAGMDSSEMSSPQSTKKKTDNAVGAPLLAEPTTEEIKSSPGSDEDVFPVPQTGLLRFNSSIFGTESFAMPPFLRASSTFESVTSLFGPDDAGTPSLDCTNSRGRLSAETTFFTPRNFRTMRDDTHGLDQMTTSDRKAAATVTAVPPSQSSSGGINSLLVDCAEFVSRASIMESPVVHAVDSQKKRGRELVSASMAEDDSRKVAATRSARAKARKSPPGWTAPSEAEIASTLLTLTPAAASDRKPLASISKRIENHPEMLSVTLDSGNSVIARAAKAKVEIVVRSQRLFNDVAITTKPCKCKKNTHCLKLYCACFQTGHFCDPDICKCKLCHNIAAHNGIDGERTLTILQLLDRRIDAFEPRVKKTIANGCSCVKTKCLKKYCDCFTNGSKCMASTCTCKDCHNSDTYGGVMSQENENDGGAQSKVKT